MHEESFTIQFVNSYKGKVYTSINELYVIDVNVFASLVHKIDNGGNEAILSVVGDIKDLK